jgi:hypothetical protein
MKSNKAVSLTKRFLSLTLLMVLTLGILVGNSYAARGVIVGNNLDGATVSEVTAEATDDGVIVGIWEWFCSFADYFDGVIVG